RNIRTQGANAKKLSNVAYPFSNILLRKTKSTSPVTSKKTQIAMYPVKLLKYCLNSFLQIAHIELQNNNTQYE
ncbi:MAG TPA: hypothetical protein VFQ58_05090, partial [Flavisolibacter sp.]|nr:hypothetical protein [Flavisolibacter sp.]